MERQRQLLPLDLAGGSLGFCILLNAHFIFDCPCLELGFTFLPVQFSLNFTLLHEDIAFRPRSAVHIGLAPAPNPQHEDQKKTSLSPSAPQSCGRRYIAHTMRFRQIFFQLFWVFGYTPPDEK